MDSISNKQPVNNTSPSGKGFNAASSDEPKMQRRDFLKLVRQKVGQGLTLSFLSKLASGCKTPTPAPVSSNKAKSIESKRQEIKLDKRQQEVKKFFDKFPKSEELPHKPIVDKLWVPGARKCLVYIAQEHVPKEYFLDPLGFDNPEVLQVQREIRDILDFLIKDPELGLSELFLEGVRSEADLDRYDSRASHYDHLALLSERFEIIKRKLINFVQKLDATDTSKLNDLEIHNLAVKKDKAAKLMKTLEASMQRNSQEKVQTGDYLAPVKLLSENRVFLNQSEIPANQLPSALKLVKDGVFSAEELKQSKFVIDIVTFYESKFSHLPRLELQKKVIDLETKLTEEREDVLMDLISKDPKPGSLAIYGALHSWRDNIERWNKLHPDNKICLIEIKPRSINKRVQEIALGRARFIKRIERGLARMRRQKTKTR